jgi:hypothetical protein
MKAYIPVREEAGARVRDLAKNRGIIVVLYHLQPVAELQAIKAAYEQLHKEKALSYKPPKHLNSRQRKQVKFQLQKYQSCTTK